MNFKAGTVIPMVLIQVISDSIFTLEKFTNLIFTYTELPYLLNLNVITIEGTLPLNLIHPHKNFQNTTVLVCFLWIWNNLRHLDWGNVNWENSYIKLTISQCVFLEQWSIWVSYITGSGVTPAVGSHEFY